MDKYRKPGLYDEIVRERVANVDFDIIKNRTIETLAKSETLKEDTLSILKRSNFQSLLPEV